MSASVAMEAAGGQTWARALDASRSHCTKVAQERARNFYHGMKLVPEPRRSAMYALYAWMRQADDLADEAGDSGGDIAAKEAALNRFLADTHAATSPDAERLPRGPIWPAVRDLVLTYGIPRVHLDDMIAGQVLDQHKTRYMSFDELYDYCYKVASVVGLCCIQVWGYEGGERTRELAEKRGVAFQLTNILRDVMEDAGRDRVYLPAEDFDAFEVNPSMFTLGKPAELLPAIRKTIDRAAAYYEDSAPLDALVHPPGRACLYAMTAIYRGLLAKIRRDPGVVLSGRRVRLSKLRKSWIGLRATMMKGRGR